MRFPTRSDAAALLGRTRAVIALPFRDVCRWLQYRSTWKVLFTPSELAEREAEPGFDLQASAVEAADGSGRQGRGATGGENAHAEDEEEEDAGPRIVPLGMDDLDSE